MERAGPILIWFIPAVWQVQTKNSSLFFQNLWDGCDRIIQFSIASEDPTQIWATMTAHLAKGDISGAISCFSAASADDYHQTFLAGGSSKVISTINAIGPMTPVLINNSLAEYYFTSIVAGQTITFSVHFDKENGNWIILSF